MDYYICKDSNQNFLRCDFTIGALGILDGERYVIKRYYDRYYDNYKKSIYEMYEIHDLMGNFKLCMTMETLNRYFYSLKEYRKRKLIKLNELCYEKRGKF
jgi:hypothetical protein